MESLFTQYSCHFYRTKDWIFFFLSVDCYGIPEEVEAMAISSESEITSINGQN